MIRLSVDSARLALVQWHVSLFATINNTSTSTNIPVLISLIYNYIIDEGMRTRTSKSAKYKP